MTARPDGLGPKLLGWALAVAAVFVMGCEGDEGPEGPVGPQGAQGEAGPTGAVGPQGPGYRHRTGSLGGAGPRVKRHHPRKLRFWKPLRGPFLDPPGASCYRPSPLLATAEPVFAVSQETTPSPPSRLPCVSIVGTPNVGKSTLFNRLTRDRRAIVSDRPGVTRDRQFGIARVGERSYVVVDTGPGAGRGQTLVDRRAPSTEANAVEVAEGVDSEAAVEFLVTRLAAFGHGAGTAQDG